MAHYPLDVQKIKAHFLTCSAHKFHGPKGIGFLYINSSVRIHPYITGGAQERNMRAGTENIYGIVGLAKALEIACEHMDEHQHHIGGLKAYMKRRLMEEMEDIRFNGDVSTDSLYTVLNVSFPPTPDSEMFLMKLDIMGISASGGSACSSGSNVGSHVLAALQVPEGRPNVRFSFSRYNTREEVDYIVEVLKKMYADKKVSV
jgi:cysteine desulfurase